jgi:hypothetical protein
LRFKPLQIRKPSANKMATPATLLQGRNNDANFFL